MSDDISIRLSDDEALVLLEMLSRWFEEPGQVIPAGAFAHDAERALLATVLTAQLEKQVVAIFAENYEALLNEARQRVMRSYPPYELG